jgi:hypothetical protein
LTLVVEEFKQAKKEFTMEQELKQRLDKIEAKLDQILELAGGEKGSTILSEVMEKYKNPKNADAPKSAKDSTTGIPDPQKDPQQYNEAMKKYETPDGNR